MNQSQLKWPQTCAGQLSQILTVTVVVPERLKVPYECGETLQRLSVLRLTVIQEKLMCVFALLHGNKTVWTLISEQLFVR